VLTELRIVDVGIIESVELSLAAGLNVLTGETGAGKSMIIGAAGLLRGGRASTELVRKGADEAVIEALFDLRRLPLQRALLADQGLPADGDELLIRRVVARSGRGKIWVNGSICTAAVLGRVTAGLLEISGQHEYQSLSDRQRQRELLDALALTAKQREEMAAAHQQVEEAAQRLAGTQLDDRQRAERSDFLRFQLHELERAQLQEGEDEQLEADVGRLRRASDLVEAASGAEAALYSDDGSICEGVAAHYRRLAELAAVDGALEPLAGQLEEARVLLEDAALSLGRYAGSVENDPAQLEAVEDRLGLLHRLRRKYGGSLAEIIERATQMRQELDELDSLDSRREELQVELEQARDAAAAVATRISTARRRLAGKLSKQLGERLAELSMKGARMEVCVEPRPPQKGDPAALVFRGGADARRLTASGWDRVEFTVATNAGEDPRPIGRIASGGELSRLMLALRQVLGEHEPAGTSIFDEVDAGIGGATADVVGRSLGAVARHRQVLVVTHLPQVAAHGARHFHIGKGRSGRRTVTTGRTLEGDERIEELARMLAGSRVTAAARENARGLLEAAATASSEEAPASRPTRKGRRKKA
jgi:DNA repair protein RecN (Recombination protein N)